MNDIDVKNVAEKVKEDLADSVDDFSEQLHELKGILSEALGDLPFKVAIIIVVVFNLLYTLYRSFLATRTDNVIESDCYCNPTDRTFYRTIMLVSMIFWIIFLFAYAFKSTFGHGHFTRYNQAKQNTQETSEDQAFSELFDIVTQQERNFRAQLEDLVSTKFLDHDYAKRIEEEYISKNNTNCKDATLARNDITDKGIQSRIQQFKQSHAEKTRILPKRWYCFMFVKVLLIILRFVFRLLIVPLLQLQWFNEYAWNCLMNNIIRNYCETETSKYYIGLDHSFVLYSVYIILLVALLFTFVINWCPKGTPEVIFHYKAVRTIDALKSKGLKLNRIMISKKGHFPYQMFENEDDDDDDDYDDDDDDDDYDGNETYQMFENEDDDDDDYDGNETTDSHPTEAETSFNDSIAVQLENTDCV